MTQCSVIIPTLDRPKDLARCLSSIGRLRRGFDEIIIVDQGDPKTTRRIIADLNHPNTRLYHQATRSAARARNLGIEKAGGEFIFFIDDDVTLDECYVETAIDYLARHPDVVALTGHADDGQDDKVTLWRLLKRSVALLLLVASFRREVLRSGAHSTPLRMERSPSRDVQWLHGCHFVCRRSVFEAGFRFDKRLIRWSFGEDVMLSYQLYKHYGHGSLGYLPAFRLRHYLSPDRSLTDEAAVRMHVIYRFIFWHGEVHNGSWLNALCYLYSQIGFFLGVFKQYRRTPLLTLKALARSYRYLLANHREIARERIDYNQFITEG